MDLLDFLLGETLMALAYAPAVGEASMLAGPATDMSHRHDFGLTSKPGAATVIKRAAWKRPKFASADDAGQGLLGSAFGIDLILAKKQLRRLVVDRLPTPRLDSNDTIAFTQTLALTNPSELTTADLTAVGAAIARGRARVREAGRDVTELDALADAVDMSEFAPRVVGLDAARSAGDLGSALRDFRAVLARSRFECCGDERRVGHHV